MDAVTRPQVRFAMLKVAIPRFLEAYEIRHGTTRVQRATNNLGENTVPVIPLDPVADVAIDRIFGQHPQRTHRWCNDEVNPSRIVRVFGYAGLEGWAGAVAVSNRIGPSAFVADSSLTKRADLRVDAE